MAILACNRASAITRPLHAISRGGSCFGPIGRAFHKTSSHVTGISVYVAFRPPPDRLVHTSVPPRARHAVARRTRPYVQADHPAIVARHRRRTCPRGISGSGSETRTTGGLVNPRPRNRTGCRRAHGHARGGNGGDASGLRRTRRCG